MSSTDKDNIKDVEDDLEDGEIDDDDDDIAIVEPPPVRPPEPLSKPKSVNLPATKSRSGVVEDDFAVNIENAIAKALKKDGIEPPMPNIKPKFKSHAEESNRDDDRRFKRRKTHDWGDKKKKKKYDGPEKNDAPPYDANDDGDEYEFLCVRGASPLTHTNTLHATTTPLTNRRNEDDELYDSDGSNSSYGSYSSNDYRSRNYDDRRSIRKSSRDRDRRPNRDRDNRRQLPRRENNQKNTHGRDNKTRSRNVHKNNRNDDTDDERNRKMEICKFYLMDCCAKREKCLYMHSDFPCKFYYLGMRCIAHEKDACKFNHGKPLTDNLRSILLKHLETAPKEILGDFPRLNRDNAFKLMDNQNQKLMVEFGMLPPKLEATQTTKIPSLLDMPLIKPSLADETSEKNSNKARRSRWCDAPPPQANTTLTQTANSSLTTTPASNPSTNSSYLGPEFLTRLMPTEQIEKLTSLGITSVEQINQLTVAQLNDLGITIDQIKAIQLNSLNIKKLATAPLASLAALPPELITVIPVVSAPLNTTPTQLFGDLDMRIPPTTAPPAVSESLNLPSGDVDMRVIPSAHENSPNNMDTDKVTSTLASSSTINYSQYLRDSNLENILDDDINETSDAIEDNDDEHDSTLSISQGQLEDEPKLEIVLDEDDDYDVGGGVKNEMLELDNSEKIQDIDHRPQDRDDRQLLFSTEENSSPSTVTSGGGPRNQDPRLEKTNISAMLPPTIQNIIEYYTRGPSSSGMSPSQTILDHWSQPNYSEEDTNVNTDRRPIVEEEDDLKKEISSNSDKDDKLTTTSVRSTIYDIPTTKDDDEVVNVVKKVDRDMRVHCFGTNPSGTIPEIGDVDLRLPFKSIMNNYVPATEIDASITSHGPMDFRIVEIEIPSPDYSDIRRSFPTPTSTLDPRLRRIFAIAETPEDDGLISGDNFQHQVKNQSGSQPTQSPLIDPRRRKELENSIRTNDTLVGRPLDIQSIVQKSTWYRDLSSKQKITVNQYLANLTSDLKQFNADINPDKKFETSPIMQQMLSNLGVSIDSSGQLHELPDNLATVVASGLATLSPGRPTIPPNIMSMMMSQPPPIGPTGPLNFLPPPSMPIQFPPNFNPNDNRPGLLGIAPNIPFNFDQVTFQQFEDYMDGRFGEASQNSGMPNFNPNHRMRNNFNNNRGNRGGGGGGNMDRWRNMGGGNARNNNQRRNFDRDSRRQD